MSLEDADAAARPLLIDWTETHALRLIDLT
jgi:hypothetical protein